ncbi:hypothetical protein KIW84_031883 [Lathyrus oleraceus]|uniref:Uncharacterized protein n=1 Tax=Pisum sativum TaxID=3888 RepID=A0A9D4XWI3_PEA|nr:hypothetical protein KIW84_031883 [Pisum sativum]
MFSHWAKLKPLDWPEPTVAILQNKMRPTIEKVSYKALESNVLSKFLIKYLRSERECCSKVPAQPVEPESLVLRIIDAISIVFRSILCINLLLAESINKGEDDDLAPEQAAAEVIDAMALNIPKQSFFPVFFELASAAEQAFFPYVLHVTKSSADVHSDSNSGIQTKIPFTLFQNYTVVHDVPIRPKDERNLNQLKTFGAII